jgi:hypothetical protein
VERSPGERRDEREPGRITENGQRTESFRRHLALGNAVLSHLREQPRRARVAQQIGRVHEGSWGHPSLQRGVQESRALDEEAAEPLAQVSIVTERDQVVELQADGRRHATGRAVARETSKRRAMCMLFVARPGDGGASSLAIGDGSVYEADMRGQCQCAQVVVDVERVLRNGMVCCCSMCRRISGSPMSYVLLVAREAFRVANGRDALASYASSPNTLRWHCGTCHAPVYAEVTDNPALPLFVPAGILDEAAWSSGVAFQPIFAADLAPWHAIDWSGPVHPGAPPPEFVR